MENLTLAVSMKRNILILPEPGGKDYQYGKEFKTSDHHQNKQNPFPEIGYTGEIFGWAKCSPGRPDVTQRCNTRPHRRHKIIAKETHNQCAHRKDEKVDHKKAKDCF